VGEQFDEWSEPRRDGRKKNKGGFGGKSARGKGTRIQGVGSVRNHLVAKV